MLMKGLHVCIYMDSIGVGSVYVLFDVHIYFKAYLSPTLAIMICCHTPLACIWAKPFSISHVHPPYASYVNSSFNISSVYVSQSVYLLNKLSITP